MRLSYETKTSGQERTVRKLHAMQLEQCCLSAPSQKKIPVYRILYLNVDNIGTTCYYIAVLSDTAYHHYKVACFNFCKMQQETKHQILKYQTTKHHLKQKGRVERDGESDRDVKGRAGRLCS